MLLGGRSPANFNLGRSRTLAGGKNHFASKPVASSSSSRHCSAAERRPRPICRWRKFAHLPSSFFRLLRADGQSSEEEVAPTGHKSAAKLIN